MRKLLTSMLTLTLVFGSVMATPVFAEGNSEAVMNTVNVTFIDVETKAPVGEKVDVEVVDGMINTGRLRVPSGYEVCIPGDLLVTPGDYLNVEVRKVTPKTVEVTFINEETKAQVGEKVNVEVVDGMINTGRLTVPSGYEVCIPGDLLVTPGDCLNVEVRQLKVEVTFIDKETKAPVGDKIYVKVEDGMVNTGRLTAPSGYEVCIPGDVLVTPGDCLNVEVRKVAPKTVEVTFIDEETKAPVGEKLNVEVVEGKINTTKLVAPKGYEVCVKGDVTAVAGAGLNIEVRQLKVEVTFIDEETKAPVGDKIYVKVEDGMVNTGRLTAPKGYVVCESGDVLVNPGDCINVEVRKAAVEPVEVTFIDEETKAPVGEKINVEPKDGMINTGRLTAPKGYDVCVKGDILVNPGDCINVEVRKVAEAKTVYVSYINEADKTPFENGIEKITVKADATYFNTSILKEVPAGYELVLTGDIYFGNNDTVNVEVRKVTTPSKPQGDNKPNTGASSSDKNHKKPVAAVATPLPGANYTYVVPNTATK